jgi:poly(3-hydroxybutyrate) depolymerase
VDEVVGDVHALQGAPHRAVVRRVGDRDLDIARPRAVAELPRIACHAPDRVPALSSSGTSRPPMYPEAPVTRQSGSGQLTQAMFGATALSARVMAKSIPMPVDTALWAYETTNRKPPKWNSRNEVVLAAPFALLRDFSVGDDDVVPTLLFPPLAGHASCIIDKKGQSQVQLCITMGLTKLYSFDWLSATNATKDTTEADRLDFITRAVDLIAGPEGKVNIVGDCQGGWEAALWAAMHPERVNTLIVAGAPIDTSAGEGPAKKLMPIVIPRGNMALYKAMVKAYGGIWPGINSVMGFIAMHPATHVAEHLKVYAHVHDREYLDHFSDFYDWYFYPIDLPGKLYLWAVEHLFVKNELFKGELEVAGKTVSLRSITCPVFLLGGEQDDITPWQQVHNMRYAVGSSLVRWHLAPGGHIGLFIGRTGRRLSTGPRSWPRSASSHDQ